MVTAFNTLTWLMALGRNASSWPSVSTSKVMFHLLLALFAHVYKDAMSHRKAVCFLKPKQSGI